MNRKEWANFYKYYPHVCRFLYGKNIGRARRYWKPRIDQMKIDRPGIRVVLHHIMTFPVKDWNNEHYELWTPMALQPMYNDDHIKLHARLGTYNNKGRQSDEAQAKRSASLKAHWARHYEERCAKQSHSPKSAEWHKHMSENKEAKFEKRSAASKVKTPGRIKQFEEMRAKGTQWTKDHPEEASIIAKKANLASQQRKKNGK